MFNDHDSFTYKYSPILSISPAEMNAIEELPNKDKDLILPIIPLRGWVGSQKLTRSVERINKAIDSRCWIADIDAAFIQGKMHAITGNYPRDVFSEIERLLDSSNGYDNWYQYLKEIREAIPTIQLGSLRQLEEQVVKLGSLKRGLSVRFTSKDIDSAGYIEVLQCLADLGVDNLIIIFDYGQITNTALAFEENIAKVARDSHDIIPLAIISISCSSFPSSFSGQNRGENPIYERQLFGKVHKKCPGIKMIYSDRGGARAVKIGGGGGIPSPRIDYPLTNDWRFIRKEFEDSKNPTKEEKERLYTEIAGEIIDSDYWVPDLHLWGTQVIELTSKGERLGINNPSRATAVRINIHLYRQLHYDTPIDLTDTDEDWEDE